MAQYIDKDALVAEIEKKKKSLPWGSCASQISMECNCKNEAYNDVISLINSLQVKEVDLEKEIQAFAKIELEPIKIYDANVGITITMHQLYQCAKHFFELRLKTQKGK